MEQLTSPSTAWTWTTPNAEYAQQWTYARTCLNLLFKKAKNSFNRTPLLIFDLPINLRCRTRSGAVGPREPTGTSRIIDLLRNSRHSMRQENLTKANSPTSRKPADPALDRQMQNLTTISMALDPFSGHRVSHIIN